MKMTDEQRADLERRVTKICNEWLRRAIDQIAQDIRPVSVIHTKDPLPPVNERYL